MAGNVQNDVRSLATWSIGGSTGSCAGDYTTPLTYSIGRRQNDMIVDLPEIMDVCVSHPVNLTVRANQDSVNGLRGWNPVVTATNGSFEILGLNSYGGAFSGTVSSVPASVVGATNPVFTMGPTPIEQSSDGSIVLDVRLPAGSSVTPSSFSSRVDFDDTEDKDDLTRIFNSVGSDAPTVIRQGDLQISVSPDDVNVFLENGSFTITVLNGGDGPAVDTVITNVLPSGLTTDPASSVPFPDTSSSTTMSWNLGTIPEGETRAVVVGFSVTGNTCSIPDGSNSISATWGCNSQIHETETNNLPNFVFPDGQMSVLHDTTLTDISLCGPAISNVIELSAKNTGITQVKNVVVNETLNPASTGIDLVPGTVSYQVYSGNLLLNSFGPSASFDPTGSGSPYTWTKTQIPELENLYPNNTPGVGMAGGPVTEVKIRFNSTVSDNANNGPSITSNATADLSCGNTVNSPGTNYAIPVKKPDMSIVEKLGRVGSSGDFEETVYGGAGDTIEWQIKIRNSGDFRVENLKLTENIPNSPAAPTYNISCDDTTSATGQADLSVTTLANIAAGGAETLCTVTQILDSSVCINEENVASIQWGCTPGSTLPAPTVVEGRADLVMDPDFASSANIIQNWVALPGGRGRIELTILNTAARAQNISISQVLPPNFVYDSSHSLTIGGTSALTLTSATPSDGSTNLNFVFANTNLPGATEEIEYNETMTISFGVKPIASFDNSNDFFTNPETLAMGYDPVPPTGGLSQITFNFSNSCGTANSVNSNISMDPLTPDVDISLINPESLIAEQGEDYCFDFTLINNGDSGSIADQIEFIPQRGTGWAAHGGAAPNVEVVSSDDASATLGACAGSCVPAQIGSLDQGDEAVVRICGQATTSGPLTIAGQVLGHLFDEGGVDTGNDYSNDTAKARVIGFEFSKTVVSTSETWTACVDDMETEPCLVSAHELAIGEDITYRLHGTWFGLDPSTPAENISNITLRDTLPAGLGYISHSNTGAHTVTYTGPTGTGFGNTGQIDFSVNDIPFTFLGGVAVFEVDLVARNLNVASPGGSNNFDASFDIFAQNFSSSEFGGTESRLHDDDTPVSVAPILDVDKTVAKVFAGPYSDNLNAVAGQDLYFQIELENTGTAPAFDFEIDDTLGAKLELIDLTTDTVNNDGDSTFDGTEGVACASPPCEGNFTAGLGGSVNFDHSNTDLSIGSHPAVTPSVASLFRLDPGESIILTYRSDVDISANPTEVLSNSVSWEASSLPGDCDLAGQCGNQSGTQGNADSTEGEKLYTDTDVSNITIDNASLSKSIQNSSVGNDTDPNFLIGEQVQYRLELVIPEGTSPGLVIRDSIPEGYRAVQRSAPVMGSGITGCSATPSPALPLDGSATLVWTFSSSCVAGIGESAVNRTIQIDYILQVRNINAVQEGTSLANSATFEINSVVSSSVVVNATAKEPDIDVVTKSVTPINGFDAGNELLYEVSLTNNGTVTAYDISLEDTLPADVSYVASSTTIVAPAPTGIATLNEPDLSSTPLIRWGRTSSPAQTLDLLAGETLTFRYRVSVDVEAEPSQVFVNNIEVDYTSLPALGSTLPGAPALGVSGSDTGERNDADGSGATVDNYINSATSTATMSNNFSVSKTSSGDTVSGGGFRVGDIVTYTVQATLQQGTVDSFVIRDVLPSGMSYLSTVSVTASGAPVTYTGTPNPPTVGPGQNLAYDFGTVEVDATTANGTQTISVQYTARVMDDLANTGVTGSTLNKDNLASASYENFSGTAQTTATSTDRIEVKQPQLTFAKALHSSQTSSTGAGETVRYQITVTNTGTAPAYNIVIQDILPDGMRIATPATDTALSEINGGGAGSYADAVTSYVSGTGIVTWKLKDTDPANFLNPGESWILVYTATVDSTTGAGQALINDAEITEFFSKPESDATERRSFTAPASGSATVNTPAPTDLDKTLTLPVGGNVAIGEPVRYIITVPDTTVDAALYDVNVLDTLPDELTGITITSSVTGSPHVPALTITDNTAGDAVSVNFSYIPANEQAIVQIDAVLANHADNNEVTVKSNSATFNWKAAPAGAATTVGPETANFTVVEPDLAVSKTLQGSILADAGVGFQAGDTAIFRITISNDGTENAVAYDFDITDISDELLSFSAIDPGSANNPGVPTGGAPAGGLRTYTWASGSGDMPTSLAPGASYTFDAQFVLDATVGPAENLSNEVQVTWTSQPGVNANERDGSDTDTGGMNDYYDDDNLFITTGSVVYRKTLQGSDTTFNVGEEVTFDLSMVPLSGVLREVRFVDHIPAGLTYVSHVLSQTNVQRPPPAAPGTPITVVSAPPSPTDGMADITFDLGDVQSLTGASQVLLSVTFRVDDIAANIDGASLQNTSDVLFDDPNNIGTDITLSDPNEPSITVSEPVLDLALDGPSNLTLGADSNMTLRLENSGSGLAYQPTVQVQLPESINDTDPSSLGAITVNVTSSSGGRNLVIPNTSYTINFVPGTPSLFEIAFTGADAYLDTNESMNIVFSVTPDNDTSDSTNVVPVATVTALNSSDVSTAVNVDNRIYANTLGSGTVGTANQGDAGDVPDDHTDNHSMNIEAPTIVFTKSVDSASYDFDTESSPHELIYTLRLENNGTANATLNSITDTLNASYFKAGSLAAVGAGVSASDGSPGILTLDPTGPGGAGVGVISYTGDTVDAGSFVEIQFRVEMQDFLPSGTVIENQATADINGFSDDFVTDSTNAADNNPAESGNNSADPNDDDATRTTVQTSPFIVHQKTSNDINGAPLSVGDIIEYTITVQNTGTEHVVNARLMDLIPSNSTYVSGSTTLNSNSVSDVGSSSPLNVAPGLLIEGLDTGSVANGAGRVEVGSTATITFRVTVDSSSVAGTQIINQSSMSYEGEGGMVHPVSLSDDPATAANDDPTINVVGDGPVLSSEKSVRISNDINSDGILDSGEEIEWEIKIQNVGTSVATNVVLSDLVPASFSTYVNSSIEYDALGNGTYVLQTDVADADLSDFNFTTTGAVTVNVGDLNASSSVGIRFKATVNGGAPVGSLISNQGTITSDNFTTIQTDCDASSANGFCPTIIPVGAVPVLSATKVVTDINGGLLQPGDEILYTVTLSNVGLADADSVTFRDPGPSATPAPALEYVLGSTFLDGVNVADIASNMPYVTAFPGTNIGNIAAGSSRTIQFSYEVPLAATAGTVYENQAYFDASNFTCPTLPTSNEECVTDSNQDDSSDIDGDGLLDDDDSTKITVGSNAGKADVEGYVYLDDAHDRLRAVGVDEGQEFWNVNVYLCSNPIGFISTTTDANGFWSIKGLNAGGPYCIDFVHPTTGVVYGNAQSSEAGVDLSTGSIRTLTLPASTTVVEQNLPLDPFGVVYDSVTRDVVEGVTVSLEFESAPGVWSLVPASDLLAGQQGQVTGTDGYYQFNLKRCITGGCGTAAATGNYRVALTNPSAYVAGISSIIPDDNGVFSVPGGLDPPVVDQSFDSIDPPAVSVSPTDTQIIYHTSFSFDPSDTDYADPIFNHLPIDPILDDALVVTKRSHKEKVSRGSFVPYTLTFSNNLPAGAPLIGINLIDQMPPGFSYVPGSARLEGVSIEPQINGRLLTWPSVDFDPGQTKTLKLILIAGIGVSEGRYDNYAYGIHNASGRAVSNRAEASVLIVPDPTFDCPELIGKVFDDKNRDGYQDEGEEGLPGIKLVTPRGWILTTDQYGRYHITCPVIPNEAIGSNVVVKLDERSLPSGYRITTENPRVVRFTRGKMSKLDFGATIDQILRIELRDNAFVIGEEKLLKEWKAYISEALKASRGKVFRVRLAYWNSSVEKSLAEKRLKNVKEFIDRIWKALDQEHVILFETETTWSQGAHYEK